MYEELAEIALARGDPKAAAPWAAKAATLLENDRSVPPARLARLAAVARDAAP